MAFISCARTPPELARQHKREALTCRVMAFAGYAMVTNKGITIADAIATTTSPRVERRDKSYDGNICRIDDIYFACASWHLASLSPMTRDKVSIFRRGIPADGAGIFGGASRRAVNNGISRRR